MQKKLHLTFKAALKLFFKNCWFYFLMWPILICLFILSPSRERFDELHAVMIMWAILPLFFALMFSLAATLTFTDEKLIVICNTNLKPSIIPIKYPQINHLSISQAPEEISVIYQLSNTRTYTIKIFPNDYNTSLEEILSYFPSDIPVIKKED